MEFGFGLTVRYCLSRPHRVEGRSIGSVCHLLLTRPRWLHHLLFLQTLTMVASISSFSILAGLAALAARPPWPASALNGSVDFGSGPIRFVGGPDSLSSRPAMDVNTRSSPIGSRHLSVIDCHNGEFNTALFAAGENVRLSQGQATCPTKRRRSGEQTDERRAPTEAARGGTYGRNALTF